MVTRRGRGKKVCARGAHLALLRGPSTSPLDGMSRVLLWLCRKSSGYVFALTWLVFLAGATLTTSWLPVPIRAFGALMGTIVLFGYPFVLIFGFPAPYSTDISRRVSNLAVLVIIAACIAAAIDPHSHYEIPMSWPGALLGVPLAVLLFSPFFVATHVLGEARRALGSYKPTDSIGAWVALFYFAFGGVFFLHRTVAATAEVVLKHRKDGRGMPSNNRWSGP